MEAGLCQHLSSRPSSPCASVSRSYRLPGEKRAPDRHYCSHRCKTSCPSEPGAGVPGARSTKPQVTGPPCNSVAESRRGEGDEDILAEAAAAAGGVGSKRPGGLAPQPGESDLTAKPRATGHRGDPGTVAKGTMESDAEWSRPPSEGWRRRPIPPADPFAPCPRPPVRLHNPSPTSRPGPMPDIPQLPPRTTAPGSLDPRPLAPQPRPRARPHTSASRPPGANGRTETLSEAERGEGRPNLGGRGRAPARARDTSHFRRHERRGRARPREKAAVAPAPPQMAPPGGHSRRGRGRGWGTGTRTWRNLNPRAEMLVDSARAQALDRWRPREGLGTWRRENPSLGRL